ncbi:integrase arm-type DNA-binding domain-containing protein [Rhizobium sp. L245/93]|uniref:tyrosine-type recombinase/integrase n=1 Tax=Rhizobium sp. L245/93 TaxID=2819998 RepID=UPI001AD976FC|nr:integrase arm-type DNA-binding domain-containing protein [Rhizobium sp. L245/93]MBO9168337.1 integrase arm-type DNA-binding domain-containing protein [Rhizobium sp. L245/93]
MTSKSLTDATVKNAKAKASRYELADGGTGLYLVVQTSGFKSWAYRYAFAKKSYKLKIGIYPTFSLKQAREKATEYGRMRENNLDPALELTRREEEAKKTDEARLARQLDKLWDRYQAHSASKNDPRFLKEKERMWRRELQPVFGARPADEITSLEITTFVTSIADRGSVTWARRVLSMAGSFFTYLVQCGLMPSNPAKGVPLPGMEISRERALNADEVRLFWKACTEIGYPFGDMGKMLLMTATRLRETAEAVRKEFPASSTELGWRWIIPKERTKNGKALTLPLPEQVVKLIKALPVYYAPSKDGATVKPSQFLFTTKGDSAVSGFSRAKGVISRRMYEIAKKEAEERGEDADAVEMIAEWRFHDLRRTAATFMASLGHQPHVVEAILNHQEELKGVALIYNQYSFATEKVAALKDWADHLDRIVTGEKFDNVVSMFRNENTVVVERKKTAITTG